MALALGPQHDFFDRTYEVVLRDFFTIFAGGQNCAFVHERIEVGAGESRRALGHHTQVDVFGERLLARMYL